MAQGASACLRSLVPAAASGAERDPRMNSGSSVVSRNRKVSSLAGNALHPARLYCRFVPRLFMPLIVEKEGPMREAATSSTILGNVTIDHGPRELLAPPFFPLSYA